MDLKLKGKQAFVSGSTAGIGFAVALGLAREGAEVVINGRTDAKISEVIQRMAGATVPAVSGSKQCPQLLTPLLGEFGKVSSELGLNIPTDTVHYGMTKTARRRSGRLERGFLPN
jgi:NAD(P)-dependent dehydrogenase (short-subunit alcohol dehydrogenase family)